MGEGEGGGNPNNPSRIVDEKKGKKKEQKGIKRVMDIERKGHRGERKRGGRGQERKTRGNEQPLNTAEGGKVFH